MQSPSRLLYRFPRRLGALAISGMALGVFALAVALASGPAAGDPDEHARNAVDTIPTDLSIVPDPCHSEAPQRWGADDQRGNANYLTPEKVLRALKLAKTGQVQRLDHLLVPGRNGVIGNFTMQTFRPSPPNPLRLPYSTTSHERLMQPLVISQSNAE